MTWIIIISAIAADRVSKVICRQYLRPLGSIPVIKGVFHLTYVENTGAAFGMLQGNTWFLILTSVLVSAVVAYLIWKVKPENRYVKISLALILGGALGNLVDRVLLGYVVDFLDFRIWPVFNIADSCVVVGAILLGYFVVVKGENIV
ncbi:MAG: signal peptidase II [Clostridiales bacterium]|jgi:signal peptidase II|nr:signal peptidase II [Clostridiales bacterium]HQA47243.1 signal peptidase II [Bacillota bacterium]HQD41501.1 signal peptidase II [Bacillota bacterium]